MLTKFPTFRKVMLLTGVLLLTALAVYLALQTVLAVYPQAFSTDVYYQMMPMNLLLIGILFGVYGLFSLGRKRFGELFIGLSLTVFYTLIIMMAANFFFRAFSYSRSVLLVTAVYELILLGVWLWFMWRLERFLMVAREALVIGSEKACAHVLLRLSHAPELGIRVRHIATDGADSDAWRETILCVDLVILCSDVALTKKSEIVGCCQELQKDVLLTPSVYELYCSELTIDKIDDIPFFRPQYLNPSLERRALKRISTSSFRWARSSWRRSPCSSSRSRSSSTAEARFFINRCGRGATRKNLRSINFAVCAATRKKRAGRSWRGKTIRA